jgi:hypothetical protein
MADETKESKKEGQRQTDLAEGELDTVEESIREHEKKGDEPGRPPARQKAS